MRKLCIEVAAPTIILVLLATTMVAIAQTAVDPAVEAACQRHMISNIDGVYQPGFEGCRQIGHEARVAARVAARQAAKKAADDQQAADRALVEAAAAKAQIKP